MKRNAKALSVAFLFDDTLDSTAGVAQYVKAMGGWLSRHGHRVAYLVGESSTKNIGHSPVYSLAKNLHVRFNANRATTPLPTPNAKRIEAVLTKERPDVLYVQTPFSPFMAGRVISRAPESSVVIGSFNILPAGRLSRLGAKGLKLLLLPSLKRIDKMLAVSPAAAAFAEEAFGLKAEVSPNVINLKDFNVPATSRKSGQPKRVVFLGRLVERKGARQLLEAFHQAFNASPHFQLTLAGAGPLKKDLEDYVKANGLSGVIDFPGFIDETAKAALLATADIACFPSLFGESFGISLLEGMAAARGVVLGGDNPGYKTVLGAQPKLLIDPLNTGAFADRLKELLDDSELARELHEWQQAEVKRYDVEVVGPHLVDIFRSSIAKRRLNR